MNPHSSLMATEAATAHEFAGQLICRFDAEFEPVLASLSLSNLSMVVTCARGSSDHAALFLKFLLETQCGLLTSSLSPSVCSVYGMHPEISDGICIAISQSGCSTDILSVVRSYSSRGTPTVAIVNDVTSPLATVADFVIPMLAGSERSVAATKTFIATLTACLLLLEKIRPSAINSSEVANLPNLLKAAVRLDWSSLVEGLANAQSIFVLGRGPTLAIAEKAALKLKEVCGIHAEALSSAEVHHGPMALMIKNFPILIFRPNDAGATGVDDFAKFAVELGCRVYVAGRSIPGAMELPTVAAHPLIEPILQIQAFYLAVDALATRRGLDPDAPPNLKKVTVTV
ncbi:MAG: hypothetical protein RL145_571 [Pseudomonadota bacterium]